MTLKIYNELHAVVRKDVGFTEKWINFFYKNYSYELKEKVRAGICLDAGCGGTVKGVRLINKFKPAKIFACDINEDHKAFYLQEYNVNFICCDIASLIFQNNYFDFILCNGVVHHTPNPWMSIRELYRVLKPGGIIHISVYCFKNSLFFYLVLLLRALAKLIPFRFAKSLARNNFILNVLLDHAYVPHEFIYTKNEFVKGLEKLGIVVDCVLNVAESHKDDKSVKFLVRNEGLFFGDGAILSFIGHKNIPGNV